MNIKLSEIPTTGGIYKFTNLTTSKIYIGSAKNLRKRFVQHISNLRLGKHHSPHFQNAWNKYGENDFIYEIIEHIELSENLLTREQYYLDTLLFAQEYINKQSNKFLEIGYNINPSASNRLGTKQSKESVRKSVLNNNKVLPVLQYDFNGNFIGEFISTGEAAKSSGVSRESIYSCCKRLTDHTQNYYFIFKRDLPEFKEYFESLKENPFIPQVWNKGLKGIRYTTEDKLIMFDRYGRFIKTYQCQIDIAKEINCTTSNLSKSKNKKPCKHYYIFDLDFDYKPIVEKLREEYKYLWELEKVDGKIMMFDIFDNYITSFDSVKECSEMTGLKYGTIRDSLTGRRKQAKGFVFKYNEDIV